MKSKLSMAIMLACLAVASEAAAQFCEIETLIISSEGDGVSADFSSVDTSTCALGIETIVHVEGSKGVVSVFRACGSAGEVITDTTEASSAVAVLVSIYDRCLGAQVRLVSGTGEADELHVSQNLKTASLRAAFEGTDDSGQTVPIAVDLVWNGSGNKEQIRDRGNGGHGWLYTIKYAASGTIRDGVAVGSVTVNGTDETPLPSNAGTIEKDASREFTEYR